MSHHHAGPRSGRLRAAWTLALLTTICAELTFTAVAVPLTWLLLPLLMVMYGAGVLLLREAAARTGAGWPSLVLLGLAYQLAEDGLGLQALTSPQMYGAAEWGWRALGVNWSYWVSQIGVHVVFSVLIPIALTDLLFPAHRGRPYLHTRGLFACGALALAGVCGLRFVISATEDPGYRTPGAWTAGFILAIVALAATALYVLPGRATPEPAPAATAPRPVTAGLCSALATIVFLGLLLPPGLGPDAVFGDRVARWLPVTAAVLVALGFGYAFLRWRGAANWAGRHRVWLVGGLLVGHTVFMMPASRSTALTGAITIALEVVLLVALARYLRAGTVIEQ
ncbi:hypothetical protein HGA13_21305 [Nocardia speluncae]|uniref:Uncharacterized protein n=1 Tax=Nocardia speluncae TaxID=419477 RepID=A0A846XJX6_9NOCA|nr:hypothetical protein [Nocardia speluncae]NKY35589.1 hypothetical protein [Nocardia speluncae]